MAPAVSRRPRRDAPPAVAHGAMALVEAAAAALPPLAAADGDSAPWRRRSRDGRSATTAAAAVSRRPLRHFRRRRAACPCPCPCGAARAAAVSRRPLRHFSRRRAACPRPCPCPYCSTRRRRCGARRRGLATPLPLPLPARASSSRQIPVIRRTTKSGDTDRHTRTSLSYGNSTALESNLFEFACSSQVTPPAGSPPAFLGGCDKKHRIY